MANRALTLTNQRKDISFPANHVLASATFPALFTSCMFIVPFNAAVISSLFEIITFATTIEKLLLLLSSAYLKISYKFTSCLSIIAQLPLLSIYQFKFHIPIIPREQILRIDSPFILPKNT